MSARPKRARKRLPTPPKKATSTEPPAAPSPQQPFALLSAQGALKECVGAIYLVDVTRHSLEWQEIPSPEQKVLKRALKATWAVHGWIDDLAFTASKGEGGGREGEP